MTFAKSIFTKFIMHVFMMVILIFGLLTPTYGGSGGGGDQIIFGGDDKPTLKKKKNYNDLTTNEQNKQRVWFIKYIEKIDDEIEEEETNMLVTGKESLRLSGLKKMRHNVYTMLLSVGVNWDDLTKAAKAE